MALNDQSVSIDDPRLMEAEKLAVVLGSEGEGLTSETIAQCNYTINAADVMNCEIVKDNVGGFFGDWTNAFVKDNQECKIIGESYCYTNADGLLSLFQS